MVVSSSRFGIHMVKFQVSAATFAIFKTIKVATPAVRPESLQENGVHLAVAQNGRLSGWKYLFQAWCGRFAFVGAYRRFNTILRFVFCKLVI